MVWPKKVLKKFSLIIKIWLSKNVIESLFANYSYITTGSDWFLALLANVLVVFKWSEVKVSQLCPTLCDPMDYTVHGILQARKLEWVAFLLWDLPNPGIKPKSPMLQAESLPAEPQTSILLEQLSYPESEIIHLDFIILWVIRVTRSQTMGTLFLALFWCILHGQPYQGQFLRLPHIIDSTKKSAKNLNMTFLIWPLPSPFCRL